MQPINADADGTDGNTGDTGKNRRRGLSPMLTKSEKVSMSAIFASILIIVGAILIIVISRYDGSSDIEVRYIERPIIEYRDRECTNHTTLKENKTPCQNCVLYERYMPITGGSVLRQIDGVWYVFSGGDIE